MPAGDRQTVWISWVSIYYELSRHHPARAISADLMKGTETSTVEMMPISAYASAQNGRASGSLQETLY